MERREFLQSLAFLGTGAALFGLAYVAGECVKNKYKSNTDTTPGNKPHNCPNDKPPEKPSYTRPQTNTPRNTTPTQNTSELEKKLQEQQREINELKLQEQQREIDELKNRIENPQAENYQPQNPYQEPRKSINIRNECDLNGMLVNGRMFHTNIYGSLMYGGPSTNGMLRFTRIATNGIPIGPMDMPYNYFRAFINSVEVQGNDYFITFRQSTRPNIMNRFVNNQMWFPARGY
jgi:hypothetical protein